MRGNIVGLLAAALMGVCGVASANIVYTVRISDGVETVMGTITTDGHTGPLVSSDVVAWSLAASGPVTFGCPLSLDDCGVHVCALEGCGVTTSGSEFTFDGTGRAGLAFNVSPGFSPFVMFRSSEVSVCCSPGVVDYSIGVAAPYVIGRASVPEPQTAILLGIGLACLGLACKRARRRQSAAV